MRLWRLAQRQSFTHASVSNALRSTDSGEKPVKHFAGQLVLISEAFAR
jgi:hypothetical protein